MNHKRKTELQRRPGAGRILAPAGPAPPDCAAVVRREFSESPRHGRWPWVGSTPPQTDPLRRAVAVCTARSPSAWGVLPRGGPRGQALVTMACRSHPLGGDASGRPRFLFGGSGATSANERVVLRPHFRQDGFHVHGEPPLSHAAPRRGSGGVSGVGTVRAGKRVTRQSPGPGPGHRGGADLWHNPRRPHVTASRERRPPSWLDAVALPSFGGPGHYALPPSQSL